jgi:hypothetical protein
MFSATRTSFRLIPIKGSKFNYYKQKTVKNIQTPVKQKKLREQAKFSLFSRRAGERAKKNSPAFFSPFPVELQLPALECESWGSLRVFCNLALGPWGGLRSGLADPDVVSLITWSFADKQ